jgi:hypothetical protein
MSIAVVQAVAKNTVSSTISATTAGNDLFVCINSFGSSGLPSISSVKLGTVSLTQAVGKTFSGADGFEGSWIYYLQNIAGGQTSVTVTGTNLSVTSTDGGVDILEFSGLLTSSVLDKAPAGTSGTSTSWTSPSTGTLSQANELVLGTASGFNMSNPSGGWTMVSGGGTGRRTGYKIVSDTTAQTFNGTMSISDWVGVIASFKGPASNNLAAAAVASML